MLSKCYKRSYLWHTNLQFRGISVCSALLTFLVALKSWYFWDNDEICRYFLGVCQNLLAFFEFWSQGCGRAPVADKSQSTEYPLGCLDCSQSSLSSQINGLALSCSGSYNLLCRSWRAILQIVIISFWTELSSLIADATIILKAA